MSQNEGSRESKSKKRDPSNRQTFSRKVIIVGENLVGKTALIYNLLTGMGTNEFVSAFYDGVKIEVDIPSRLPKDDDGTFRLSAIMVWCLILWCYIQEFLTF